jgi:hypothetical protein
MKRYDFGFASRRFLPVTGGFWQISTRCSIIVIGLVGLGFACVVNARYGEVAGGKFDVFFTFFLWAYALLCL